LLGDPVLFEQRVGLKAIQLKQAGQLRVRDPMIAEKR